MADRNGGIATAIGHEVFLGDAFAALGDAEQEHVLAHELAHLAQARDGTDPTADPEDDAERAAAQACAHGGGAPVTPVAAASSTEPHDFRPRDLANRAYEALGDAAGSAAEWAVEQIATVEDLQEAIAGMGEGAARTLLATLAAVKPALVAAFVVISPATAPAVYAMSRLPPADRAALLAALPVPELRRVLEVVVVLGLLGPMAASFAVQDPKHLAETLRLLHPAALDALRRELGERLGDAAQEAFLLVWKPGFGLAISSEAAVTFGVPIKGGVGGKGKVIHKERGVVELEREVTVESAADTGIGAGFFLGLEGEEPGEGPGLGVGGEATLEAGTRHTVLQKFSFPLFEDGAFRAFLLASSFQDVFTNVLNHWFEALAHLDTLSYQTRFRLEGAVYGEAEGTADGGLRVGGDRTRDGYVQEPGGDGDHGEVESFWHVLTSVQAALKGELQGEGWVELQADQYEENGELKPKTGRVEVGGSASAVLEAAARIPDLGPVTGIDEAESAGLGVGLRVVWPYTREGGVGRFLDPHFEQYVEGDRNESHARLTLAHDSFQACPTVIDSLNNIRAVELELQVGLASELGERHVAAAVVALGLEDMLGGTVEGPGAMLVVRGGLRYEGTLSGEALRGLVYGLIDSGRAYADGVQGVQELYDDLTALISEGESAPGLEEARAQVAPLLEQQEYRFEAEAGLKGAARFSSGAGVKVGAEASAGVYGVVDQDLTPQLGELPEGEVQQLLTGSGMGGGDEVEVPIGA